MCSATAAKERAMNYDDCHTEREREREESLMRVTATQGLMSHSHDAASFLIYFVAMCRIRGTKT